MDNRFWKVVKNFLKHDQKFFHEKIFFFKKIIFDDLFLTMTEF